MPRARPQAPHLTVFVIARQAQTAQAPQAKYHSAPLARLSIASRGKKGDLPVFC